MLAIIERHVDLALGAGEQQTFALRILAHGIDRRAVGNAVGDRGPGPAAVVRAVDVRPHVVEPQRVDRGVGGLRVEVAGVDDRHLHERLQLRRRDVVPRRAAVGGHLHQPVVGADPDAVDVERRRRDGVDHAALGRLGAVGAAVLADRRRRLPGLARQVLADLRPVARHRSRSSTACSRRNTSRADRRGRTQPARSAACGNQRAAPASARCSAPGRSCGCSA